MKDEIVLDMLLKQKTVKTLVTGDKSSRLVLETLYPGDVVKLKELEDVMVVRVRFLEVKE